MFCHHDGLLPSNFQHTRARFLCQRSWQTFYLQRASDVDPSQGMRTTAIARAMKPITLGIAGGTGAGKVSESPWFVCAVCVSVEFMTRVNVVVFLLLTLSSFNR